MAIVFAVAASPLSATSNLSGSWIIDIGADDPDVGTSSEDCRFNQRGQRLSVRCTDGWSLDGEVSGRKVVLRFRTGRENAVIRIYRGTLNRQASRITGTWGDLGTREGTFDAHRR